jgi:hypothetical protein
MELREFKYKKKVNDKYNKEPITTLIKERLCGVMCW